MTASEPLAGDGPPSFELLVDALRRVQDAVAAAPASAPMLGRAIQRLREVASDLQSLEPGEETSVAATPALPVRDHGLIPTYTLDSMEPGRCSGRVVFGRFHYGSGAVHGGAIPLLFDDVLGRLANVDARTSRTAALHVDFRSLTPVDVKLQVTATIDRVEGRKRYLSGVLSCNGTVCAEARGLWVVLRPGQP